MERVPQSGQAAAGSGAVALPALMAMTDHRSVASVIGYFQQGAAVQNPAARLLEEPRPPTAGPLAAAADGGWLR